MSFFHSLLHGISNTFKSTPWLAPVGEVAATLAGQPWLAAGIGAANNASNNGGGIFNDIIGAAQGYGTGSLGNTLIGAGSAGLSAAANGAGLGGSLTAAGNAISPTLTNILSGGASGTLSGGLDAAGSAVKGALGSAGSIFGDSSGSIPASAVGQQVPSGLGSALTSGGANITAPIGSGASSAGLLSTGSSFGPEGFSLNPGSYASAAGSIAKDAAPAQGLLGQLVSGASKAAPLLSAAGNIYSGYAGDQAAKSMADAQLQSTNAALGQQAKQFGQTQANLAPYQATGAAASSNLGSLLSGDPTKQLAALQATPGYQFQYDQGMRGVNQNLASQGNFFSGDALKAAQQYGQGLASTSYNNIVNQNQAASNSGQGGALGLGSLGAGNAAANTQLLTDQGNIGANQINNSNNAVNQSLSNLLGLQQYDIYGRPLRASAYGAGTV